MRIVLLSVHFAEYAIRLAQALCHEHEILLILSERNVHNELGGSDSFHEIPRLQVKIIPDRRLWHPSMWYEASQLRTRLKSFRPDVIHCQEAYRDYLPLVLPSFPCIPTILTVHDHLPHSGQRPFHLRGKLFLCWLRQRADAIIVHGQLIVKECRGLFPEWAMRLHAVPHGPLGIVGTAPSVDWQAGVVLFFGRMERYKGLSYLIEAAHILKARGVSLRIVVAGTGPDLTIQRHSIDSDPLFVVHDRFISRHEVDQLFRQANIVVLPYTDATQSGIAAMALQYGRPVVASDVGGISEMVRHDFNGKLIPPRDSTALANALEEVISDRVMAARFAENAVVLATGELSWARIANDTSKVYANAMSNCAKSRKIFSM